MSAIDVDVLNEMYTILKPYIPQKDRQEAADNLMSVMVDMLAEHDLKEFGASEGTLTRALKVYVEEEECHDDEQEEDEY